MRTPKHKCGLYEYPCLLFRHMERKMREYNYFGCMELHCTVLKKQLKIIDNKILSYDNECEIDFIGT